MADNSQNYNVDGGIGSAVRDRSPDSPVGRSGCCTRFLCLGSRKRGKRVVPATRMHTGSNASSRPWGPNAVLQSVGTNQYISLSPSLLAPPSSPASFQNSAVQSSAQSPSAFPATLCVTSAASQNPLQTTATMFQMGPYAHETALVSPPVFSTFTTAPSTAPFTPPPELASHLTTPSSPDVPFAQLLASSFGPKGSTKVQPARTYSASPFASPDIFAADDLQAAYQLYPGSPLAHLLSPASGTGESTPFPDRDNSSLCTTFPDLENSLQAVASMFFPGSSLISQEPATTMELDVESLLSKAFNSCSFEDFLHEDQLLSTTSSLSEAKLVGLADSEPGELLAGESNEDSDRWRVLKQTTVFGSSTVTNNAEEECVIEVAENCRKTQESNGSTVNHPSGQQGKLDSADGADRNLSQITVICSIECTQTLKRSPSRVGSAEANVRTDGHLLGQNSSSLGQNVSDTLVWRKLADDKSNAYVHRTPSEEKCRTESGLHCNISKELASVSGTVVIGLPESADCGDLFRLQCVNHSW